MSDEQTRANTRLALKQARAGLPPNALPGLDQHELDTFLGAHALDAGPTCRARAACGRGDRRQRAAGRTDVGLLARRRLRGTGGSGIVIGLDEINVAIEAINPHVGATNAMRDAFGDDAALEQRKHLCREIGVDYEALMALRPTTCP
jgi:hypothetical protein